MVDVTLPQSVEDALERYRVAVDAVAHEETESRRGDARVDTYDACNIALAELRKAIASHASAAAERERTHAARKAKSVRERVLEVFNGEEVSNGGRFPG